MSSRYEARQLERWPRAHAFDLSARAQNPTQSFYQESMSYRALTLLAPTLIVLSFHCLSLHGMFLVCALTDAFYRFFHFAHRFICSFEGPDWGFKSTGAQRAACLRALGKAIEDDKDVSIRTDARLTLVSS